ncbi:MAG TPA: redoxin domain-containing protein, partial [Roseimicrobium sp.]|nr:redoxin domain-containing protein [Roseimicrobium sp.]
DVQKLKIGDDAPDFRLKNIDGKFYTLSDFKKAPVLMVIFLSNHCPYSHAMEPRLLKLFAEMKPRGLDVVAIQPNHPDSVRLDELGYSKYNDSYEEMITYAKEQGFTFPYLYDGDTQAAAKAYGCLATPHVFLFDRERKLQYAGRFDDSRYADPATVTSPDTRNAVEAMLAGRPVAVAETKPMGCSTKWLSKKTDSKKVDEQWEKAPVSVEKIDAAGIKALVKNDTGKFRLFNVWATWCVPCVKEFPGLVSISRRMGSREFEIITLSADEPKDEAAVLAFLEKNHAAIPSKLKASVEKEGRKTNNYLFTGAGTEALFQALDPAAPGPVPYTVLVAPGGKVIFRHAGEFNSDELLAKILEHMGAFYKP